MTDITAPLLTMGIVLYVLLALLSLERHQDRTSAALVSNRESLSEVGLRVGLQR